MNMYKEEFVCKAKNFYQKAIDKLADVQLIIQGTYFVSETADIRVLKQSIRELCKGILADLLMGTV